MSTDRAGIFVDPASGEHATRIIEVSSPASRPEAPVHQIRSRITDTFQLAPLPGEQDNQPPALVALYRRVSMAFSADGRERDTPERSSRLIDIKGTIESLRKFPNASQQRLLLEHARTCLSSERHQLLMKNEFTEGFGRIEAWVLSITALGLVLFGVLSIFWALPILALSIGRSWYLDRQCKRRLEKVSDIDALLGRIAFALSRLGP